MVKERWGLCLNLRVRRRGHFEAKSLESLGEELSLTIRNVEVSKVAIIDSWKWRRKLRWVVIRTQKGCIFGAEVSERERERG